MQEQNRTDIPQTFQTKAFAKDWLVEYNLNESKSYKIYRSDKWLLEAICTENNCNFIFKVRKHIDNLFHLKFFREHNCPHYGRAVKTAAISNRVRSLFYNHVYIFIIKYFIA